jgi:hypothetical protein
MLTICFSRRFIVTLGWILDKPLTLLFDPYESVALFLSGKLVSILTHTCSFTYKFFFFSPSPHCKLCSSRWKVKLVGRLHSHGYAFILYRLVIVPRLI